MGIKIFKEPKLKESIMFVGWPGIGNIGILAVNTLKDALNAEELGEIDSWDFFYPRKVSIKDGLLVDLEFPGNKFYYKKVGKQDILFFIGDEQPSEGGRMYASGEKAYRMANLVVDVGLRFGCRRVYTSGAFVSLVHHQNKPRVCAVVSSEDLIDEIKALKNTIFMTETEERKDGEGTITGLNGVLLAIAKKRGLESICLMGEIPDWLSVTSFPYPKASRSVIEVFSEILGIKINYGFLERMEEQIDGLIESLYQKFPPEIKEEYDKRKAVPSSQTAPITLHAQIYVDEQLKKGGEEGGGRPS